MNDLDTILSILKVRRDVLTDIERNALLLYVVDRRTLESREMSYHDSVKIDRLIETLAYIMETKVLSQGVDHEKDIRAMGWVEDFAQERIDVFNTDSGWGWGHRMISQWAQDWLSSLMSEYRYHHIVGNQHELCDDIVF